MKKACILILFFPAFVFAQSPVTNSPMSGDELPSAACLSCPGTDWNNPMYIISANGQNATTGLNPTGNCFQSTCYYSRNLYAYNFGFAIPTGATIDSIFVDIKRGAGNANAAKDSVVQLVKSGLYVGSNLQSPVFWPTSSAYQNYGHTDPLWGTTWLPADLNDPTSGVILKVENLSASGLNVGVDHFQMTVYYNTTTGFYAVTSSPLQIQWINSGTDNSAIIYNADDLTECTSALFDVAGNLVNPLSVNKLSPGENKIELATSQLANGIYFWQIRVGDQFLTRKISVTKTN